MQQAVENAWKQVVFHKERKSVQKEERRTALMETWKTPEAAFPTFPQGPLQEKQRTEKRRRTQSEDGLPAVDIRGGARGGILSDQRGEIREIIDSIEVDPRDNVKDKKQRT
ncbi:MAG TPA: hypothetical protein VIL97_00360 [Thermoanaerobaculia bacterium]